MKFDDKTHLDYFKVGKVFRFQNVISALIPNGANDKFEKYSHDRNVTMYIDSINASHVYDYLGPKSDMEKACGRTLLFPAGSEFLVCKVEKKEDMTNIYLRNICLGLSRSHTILWTDE